MFIPPTDFISQKQTPRPPGISRQTQPTDGHQRGGQQDHILAKHHPDVKRAQGNLDC